MRLSQLFLYSKMLSWYSLHYDEKMLVKAIWQKNHKTHREGSQRAYLLCSSFPTKQGFMLTTQKYLGHLWR